MVPQLVSQDKSKAVIGGYAHFSVHVYGSTYGKAQKCHHKDHGSGQGIREKAAGDEHIPEHSAKIRYLADQYHIGNGTDTDQFTSGKQDHQNEQDKVQKQLPVTKACPDDPCQIDIHKSTGIRSQIYIDQK